MTGNSPLSRGLASRQYVHFEDLKPQPSENAHVILAYHNKGLLAWMGRQWVCWGDLRTDYIRSNELRAKLQTRVTE